MSTDFSSIDRLVEFGMGLGLAQQMVNTMNHVMNNTMVAGENAGTTGQQQLTCAAYQNQWYAAVDGQQAGPLSDNEVRELISRSLIKGDSLMWCPGMQAWKYASDIPQINKLILLTK